MPSLRCSAGVVLGCEQQGTNLKWAMPSNHRLLRGRWSFSQTWDMNVMRSIQQIWSVTALPSSLVGGWPTPLKSMSSSVGINIPHIWKNNPFMFQTTNQVLLRMHSKSFHVLPRHPPVTHPSFTCGGWAILARPAGTTWAWKQEPSITSMTCVFLMLQQTLRHGFRCFVPKSSCIWYVLGAFFLGETLHQATKVVLQLWQVHQKKTNIVPPNWDNVLQNHSQRLAFVNSQLTWEGSVMKCRGVNNWLIGFSLLQESPHNL